MKPMKRSLKILLSLAVFVWFSIIFATNTKAIVVNPPTNPGASNCQLSAAHWQKNFTAQPILGSPVHMAITGTGCSGYSVEFDVYEDSITVGGLFSTYGKVNATFDSTGTKADGSWKVAGDTGLGSDYATYYFYFKATASSNGSSTSIKSEDLQIPGSSQTGCVDCNVHFPPQTCACADGYSGDRGAAGDCGNVCSSHIGDALTDGTITSAKNYACLGPNPSGVQVYQCSQKSDCSDVKSSCAVGATCQEISSNSCGGPPGGSTSTASYAYTITNPLAGGPQSPMDIINIASQWLFNISIPLAVMFILYAGFLMLTAGANPAKVKSARGIITNVVLALAIIFIGRGFVSLIYSVIQLGTPAAHTRAIGQTCKINNDCQLNVICNNGVCKAQD